MPRVEVQFDGVSRGAVNAARQTRAAIKGVGDEGDRTSDRIGFMGRVIRYSLVRAAYAGGAALLGLGGAIGFVGFKFDNLKQQAGIAFATMLGSGQKAQRFLNELQKFAARTPFEFPDLIRASQRLLAMGFSAKQIVPTLTAVGNAVAGLGGDPVAMDATIRAIGQIQAKGRLMAEEMMQLNEAGTFSWKALAFEIGISVPAAMKAVTKGQVTAEIFLEAFARNSQRRFKGMMDKQSQTFGGLLSTLKDMFNQFAGTAMKPLFDLVTRGMKGIVNSNGAVQASAQRTAHEFGVRLAKAVQGVFNFFRSNWPQILGFIEGTWSAAKTLAGALRTVASAANRVSGAIGGWDESFKLILAGVVAAKLSRIVGVLTTVRRAMRATATSAVASEAEVAAGAEAASLRIRAAMLRTGVGLLIIAATEIILHWRQVTDFFKGLGSSLRGIFQRFWNWLKRTAITAALSVLEPFSHLPGFLGGWARRAKERLEKELRSMEGPRAAATAAGKEAAEAWYQAYKADIAKQLDKMPDWVREQAEKQIKQFRETGQIAGQAYGEGFKANAVRVIAGIPQAMGPRTVPGNVDVGAPTLPGGPGAGFVPRGGSFTLRRRDQGHDFITDPGGPIIAPGPGYVVSVNSDRGGFGPSYPVVHFTGGRFKGETMYIGHTNSELPAGARFRKGDIIARTSAAGIGSATTPGWVEIGYWPPVGHGKIGRDPFANVRGTPSGAPAPGIPLGPGSETGTTRTTRGRRGPAAADPGERRRDLAGIHWLEAHVPRLAPQLRARIRRELDAVAEAIRNAKTEAELRKATSRLEALKKKFNEALLLTGAIAAARKSARAIAEEIAKLPAAMRVDLEKRMEAVRSGLAHVLSARSLAKLRKELEQIHNAVIKALEKMQQAVDDRRGAFADAFGRLADKALRVFDAKTQQLLDNARAVVAEFGFEIGVGEETPTERFLRERGERQTVAEEQARIANLQRQLENAQDGEERARLQEELAQAQFDAETRRLEKQAEAERIAADKALAAEQKRIQDERDALREQFQDRLNEIQGKISRGELTATQAQELIAAAMAEFGIDAKTAADLIGPAFMATLTATMNDTIKAIRDLIDAINDLTRATGGVPIAPEPRGSVPPRHHAQGGGRVPGRFIGRDSVEMLLEPGEEILDRSLSHALRSYLASGGRRIVPLADRIYVLGTTEREVAQALAKLVAAPLDERISYRVER